MIGITLCASESPTYVYTPDHLPAPPLGAFDQLRVPRRVGEASGPDTAREGWGTQNSSIRD